MGIKKMDIGLQPKLLNIRWASGCRILINKAVGNSGNGGWELNMGPSSNGNILGLKI